VLAGTALLPLGSAVTVTAVAGTAALTLVLLVRHWARRRPAVRAAALPAVVALVVLALAVGTNAWFGFYPTPASLAAGPDRGGLPAPPAPPVTGPGRDTVLTVDGVEHRTDATLIAVGNTRFFGGAMAICPDADPCDGLLDVTIVGAVGRLRLLRFFPTVYSGAHRTNPAVTFLRARTVALAGGADVWADGERLGPMPLSLEAVAGAVRVAGARIGATDRAD